jgi:hypothetical protein
MGDLTAGFQCAAGYYPTQLGGRRRLTSGPNACQGIWTYCNLVYDLHKAGCAWPRYSLAYYGLSHMLLLLFRKPGPNTA